MAIETNIYFYLAVWQTIVCVFTFVIMIMSILRYTQKKTDIARKLSIAFMFFFLGNLFLILGSWNRILEFAQIENNKSFVGIFATQAFNFQFSYVFLVFGIYYIYQFSVLLSRPENNEKKPVDYIALIGSFAVLIYGFVRIWTDDISVDNEVVEILRSVDIYIVILSLIMIFPMLKTSITLINRLEKDNKHRSRIMYMFLLSIFLLAVIMSFVLETIYGITKGEHTNIFSFIAWTCVVLALTFAYLSFYRKPSEN